LNQTVFTIKTISLFGIAHEEKCIVNTLPLPKLKEIESPTIPNIYLELKIKMAKVESPKFIKDFTQIKLDNSIQFNMPKIDYKKLDQRVQKPFIPSVKLENELIRQYYKPPVTMQMLLNKSKKILYDTLGIISNPLSKHLNELKNLKKRKP
jgi:hypothetical protein